MVLLHVKRGGDGSGEDAVEFLFSTSCDALVDDVKTSIASMHSSVVRIEFLCENLEALAKYGPMRTEEQRGLELDDEKAENPDPNRIRTGTPPDPELVKTLEKVASDAKAVISKKRVQSRQALSAEDLQECEQLIRGAIMMAYPMGLPEHDVLRQWMDERLDFTGTYIEKKMVQPEHACLWFAGKKWCGEDTISKYLGRNEKTKVVVRLQRANAGAPVREPAVDGDTQKKMMAYWHRKQEEQKRLKEDSNDSYLNADWANPNQLKEHFSGTGNIKWRGPGM